MSVYIKGGILHVNGVTRKVAEQCLWKLLQHRCLSEPFLLTAVMHSPILCSCDPFFLPAHTSLASLLLV